MNLRPSESGVAMIMVLAVLLALTVLAVPFMTIAVHENRASEGPYARELARAVAEGNLKYGAYMLESGHRANEALRQAQNAAGAGGDSGFIHDTPDTDSAEESEVPVDLKNRKGEPVTDSQGVAILHRKDSRGVTADLRVRDEQAYPNLLSAPPFLISASLGRSVLAADITDTDAEIPVEDASSFPLKSGVINIEGEIISYSERQGGRFIGCQRGGAGGLKARKHAADAFVWDDRAREIAMLPFRSPRADAQGGWREPLLPTYVKEIVLLGRDALDPLEVDRIESHFSVLGRREVAGGFGEKTTVRANIDPEQDDGTGFPIRVTSTEGFNNGTLVRITDGLNTDYGIVIEARSQGGFGGGGFGQIRLAEAPRNTYEQGRTYVQPLLRHPVNVNSAPRSVLYRVIDGIQELPPFRQQPRGAEGRVSGEAATICVEGIIAARPIKDLKHFREVLEGLVSANQLIFTSPLADAVFRNAVDPNDVQLYHSTVPFCFESSDHYTLDASAVVNDGSGRELARKMIRQRVHVSPSGWLDFRIDSQADFEGPLYRGRSGKYVATLPHPTARWWSPTQMPESRIHRMLWRFTGASLEELMGAQAPDSGKEQEDEDQAFDHGVFGHQTEGHVQLLAGRMGSTGYNKHFDGPTNLTPEPDVPLHLIDANGWKLKRPFRIVNPRDNSGGYGGGQQSMQVRTRGQGRGQGGGQTVTVEVQVAGQPAGGGGGPRGSGGGRGPQRQNSGALMGRQTPNPLRFDLWWYSGSGAAGRQVLFDLVGDDADDDRIQLVREADGTLQARVHDRTIDNPLDNLEEIAIARWEPEVPGFWKANTWYHLGLAYRGTKPDDVMLFVDGFKRGQGRFQTTLSGAFDADDTSFTVDDAEGWPDRGVVMVGYECVAFERTGNAFDVIQKQGQPWGRGQRGTRVRVHGQGEPVTLFGYSGIPRTNTGSSGVAIPAGGATLKDSLSTWCVATFAPNTTMTFTIPGQGGVPVPVQLEVHDPARPGGNMLELVSNSLGVPDWDAFPASGGYIVITSRDVPVPGAPVGGIEFAKYQTRVGNQLLGVQGVPNPPNSALAAARLGIGGGGTLSVKLARSIHPVRLAGAGSIPTLNTLSAVFPVSIAISDVSGYKEPEKAENQTAAAGAGVAPTWDTDPEFVQVGTPNADQIDNNLIEWIRYHHLDKDGSHLLCDEANFILRAGYALQGFLGGGGVVGAHGWLRNFIPFRGQGGTEGLTNGRISGGCDVVPCFRTESHGHVTAINNPDYNLQTNPEAPGNGEYWSFAGWGDSVTIEGQNGRDRKAATVAWAGLDGPISTSFNFNGQTYNIQRRNNYPGHGWIAFTESPGTEYRQRALPRDGLTNARTNYVRLLKFPSGELPDIGRNARAFAGGDAEGNVASQDGYIDELRVTAFESERYVLWNHEDLDLGQTTQTGVTPKVGIDATVDEIPVCNAEWVICNPTVFPAEPRFYLLADGRKVHYDQDLQNLPGNNDAGIVRIGEEVIAFRGIGRGQGGGPVLLECQRGFLGTIPTRHGYGENVVFLDFIAVSKLREQIDGVSDVLPVGNANGFFQTGGTVLIDQEMIHYTEGQGGALTMPWRLNEQGEREGGLFRGRYGTSPRPHDAGALVLEMPFRYWDRFASRQDSAELSYYAFSLDLPGAYFHGIEVEKHRPVEHVDVETLCRTDPDVPWTAEPGKTPGLFRFEDATEANPAPIRRAGRGFDVRVMFKYTSGAFEPDLLTAHDWKATPEVRSIRVKYLDETRVLGREDVR